MTKKDGDAGDEDMEEEKEVMFTITTADAC